MAVSASLPSVRTSMLCIFCFLLLSRQFGVFLPEVELFDTELFGLMRSEALTTDPQQRLLLHAAHEALSTSGAGPAAAFGRPVGAFVGIAGELLCRRLLQPLTASSLPDRYASRWVQWLCGIHCKPCGLNFFACLPCLQPRTTRPWCTSTAGPSPASASQQPPPASLRAASPTPLACAAPRPVWTPPARRPWWLLTLLAWPSGGALSVRIQGNPLRETTFRPAP